MSHLQPARRLMSVSAGLAMLALVGNQAAAHDAAPAAPAKPGAIIPDGLQLVEGNPDSWSVSKGDAGCYLISARRKSSSSLALGRHPKYGFGLFAVNLALALPKSDPRQPVVVQANDQQFEKAGRMVDLGLLFVPLERAETATDLQEIQDKGTLWISVRGTWIGHGGLGAKAAVEEYGKTCVPARPAAG